MNAEKTRQLRAWARKEYDKRKPMNSFKNFFKRLKKQYNEKSEYRIFFSK